MKVQPTISSYSPLANFENNKKLRNELFESNQKRRQVSLLHTIIAKITEKENYKRSKEVKMFYHLYFLIDPLSISNKGIRYFRRHAETYQTRCLHMAISIFGPHNLVTLGSFFGPPKKGLCMSSTGFFLFLSFVGRIPNFVPG